MGKRYLMDTNAIHDYLQELYPEKGLDKLDKILISEANISVITQIEILSYIPSNKAFEEKIALFVEESTIFGLSDIIIEQTINLRRLYRIKIGDAVIAATAIVHDFTVVTNNERDFNKVKGLKILNPYNL